MNDDKKNSTLDALLKYSENQLKPDEPYVAQRINDDPENQVALLIDDWFRAREWDVGRYEAKARYNPETNAYTSKVMPVGVPDRMGLTPQGEPVYVEIKAPGKRSTFNIDRNYRQRNFLILKINYGAFGCVVDSVELLEQTYINWVKVKNSLGKNEAKEFLLNCLPKKRA